MDLNVDPWGSDREEWDQGQEDYDLADSDGYDDYDED